MSELKKFLAELKEERKNECYICLKLECICGEQNKKEK
jgi:hypothetical protein